MDEGKHLREAIDAESRDALDEAMSCVFGSDTDQQPDDEEVKWFGRYKLLEQIGEGGFGVVYSAEQFEPIRRRVALKVIKQGMDTRQVVARFEAERQALAMMHHENIASVFDAGATETGRPYFVMELVRGIPITDYCDRHTLKTEDRLRLFVLVCRAVQHAHQKGVIHRDLKPTNVLVTPVEGVPVPKVIDFGVAKATHLQLTEKTLYTRQGQFIGTPAYMSPEQVDSSELDVDTRSDIYSLGVLLYELLTGSTPVADESFQRASYAEMQRIICDVVPAVPSRRLSQSGEALPMISSNRATDPQRLRQVVRGELDWIVMKALEKDRARRYETANGLAEDIDRYLDGEPVAASPPSASYILKKLAWKYRRTIAVGTAFALVLLTSTLFSGWLAYRASQAQATATHNASLATERLRQEILAKRKMKEQRDLAESLGRELDYQLDQSRALLYIAHMNLIQSELETGNNPRVVELLKLHVPTEEQRDLRGFEWYYAWGLYHRHPWTWRNHTSVTGVACSPDGQFVVSGCADGRIQVWDADSGEQVQAIGGHEQAVHDIAFSPNGNLVATGSLDANVRVWQFESGRLNTTSRLLTTEGVVRRVAFSPNGTHLAVASELDRAGALKLWNLTTGTHRDVDIQNEWAYGVAFSADGDTLATGTGRTINICDVASAQVTRRIETGLRHVASLAWSHAKDVLAWGGTSGAIEVWDSGDGVHRLGRHPGWVIDLEFSPDGRLLASSGDNLAILWDVGQRKKADTLRGHSADVNAMSFVPDGASLVTASADHSIRKWDLSRGQSALRLTGHRAPVTSLVFSPADNRTLYSGGEDGVVKQWHVGSSETAEELPTSGQLIRCLDVSPDGETVAYAGGADEESAGVSFWSAKRKTVRSTVKEHSSAVSAIAFSPDGKTLASGGNDGLLILWDVATASVKQKLDSNTESIVSVAYSNEGRFLATSSFHQNAITIWDMSEPGSRSVLEGHNDWVTSLAFSPQSNLLASGSRDNTVRIWDLDAADKPRVLVGHSGFVDSVTFSPDGSAVASIGRDDRVRLWDVATGQEKTNLECQPDMRSGLALAFSADGRSLATVNDQSVVVHRAASDRDFYFHESPGIPRNKSPVPGELVEATRPVTLRATPFSHRHPDVTHLSGHWQVRPGGESYTVPVVDCRSTSNVATLSLEPGILLPDTTYFWRVAYTGLNHETTSFSEESSFTTSSFWLNAVPFDLTSNFNRDIIKNPGDRETDSIDASAGSHLTVDGFDGTEIDNPLVKGLPVDGRLGLHILGDYSRNNAIQMGSKDKTGIRITVPRHRYRFVRFVVVGGNGNSDMPVRFEYEDGTDQREIICCDDWFHDISPNRYGMLRDGLLPIRNEMDRFHGNEFRDDNAPAVFEFITAIDDSRQLVAFVLEAGSDDVQYTDTALWPDHSRARFNLLAATGLSLQP